MGDESHPSLLYLVYIKSLYYEQIRQVLYKW